MTLDEAIKELTTTYKSLDSVAMGLSVDSFQIQERLKIADPKSVEFHALSILAKHHPYTERVVEDVAVVESLPEIKVTKKSKTKKETIINDNTNQVE